MSAKPKLYEKTAYMKKMFGNLSRDVDLLKKERERLSKREKFFRSEALIHQADLINLENEEGPVFSSDAKFTLRNDQLQALKKNLECMETVSARKFSRITQEGVQVEGPEEVDVDVEVLKSFQTRKKELDETEVTQIVKMVAIEGNINKFKVNMDCTANFTEDKRNGSIVRLHQITSNPSPPIVQTMFDAFKLLPPVYITRMLSNLQFLQVLEEEREETIYRLEDSIPDIEISRESEPRLLKLHPTKEQEIELRWSIEFDEANLQLINRISVICEEEVVAYYSGNQNVFPYVSSKKFLQTADDVIDFCESF